MDYFSSYPDFPLAERHGFHLVPRNGVLTPVIKVQRLLQPVSAMRVFDSNLFSKGIMSASVFFRRPLSGLLRDLSHSAKLLFREELELVKSEVSEKASRYGRHAAGIAVGGVVAYAGLVVLLGGVGILVGWAFKKTHLDPALANVIGLGGVGLVVVLVGAIMVLKGLKAFSKTSLAPERTLDTIKQLKGTVLTQQPRFERYVRKIEQPKRSPDELKAEVLATEKQIGTTLDEIAYRANPARIRRRADAHVRTNTYSWSLAALGGGLVTSVLLRRKLHL